LVNYPWLGSTTWPLERITRFTVGQHPSGGGHETSVTLNAWRGSRRSEIGYWLDDQEKHRIYQAIAQYFQLIGRSIEFVDQGDHDDVVSLDDDDTKTPE
jgi:hypothetical protein